MPGTPLSMVIPGRAIVEKANAWSVLGHARGGRRCLSISSPAIERNLLPNLRNAVLKVISSVDATGARGGAFERLQT